MSSLCDKCYAPGQCCQRLHLSSGGESLTLWDDEDAVQQLRARGLPFVSVAKHGTWKDEESGRTYSEHVYSCPVLTSDGRCGDYDNRPEVCRIFEPASDGLCVHYGGAEAGDYVAPATGN